MLVAKRTCSIEGCERLFYGRKLCQMHYMQMRRHGRFLSIAVREKRDEPSAITVNPNGTANIELTHNRFAIIDVLDIPLVSAYCWGVGNGGYVQAKIDGETWLLHRWLVKEQLDFTQNPRKHVVEHIDDNPFNCVRSNLLPTTQSKNMLRAKARQYGEVSC